MPTEGEKDGVDAEGEKFGEVIIENGPGVTWTDRGVPMGGTELGNVTGGIWAKLGCLKSDKKKTLL